MTMKESTIGILTDKIGRISCVKCGEELDVGEYTIFERVLCPVCQAEQSVPGKLGNFLLTDELGRGGMGAVYLAKDESLGREVALKVLRQEYGNDPKFMDRLLKEAQAAAALNHRNVVQIYSFGQENHQPYIVMELVHGGRFDLLIKDQEQVDEELLLETAIDVAQGLEAAAQAGLVHGDIKPANILYDTKGVAKVVDFGLARFEGSEGKIEIWGTPYYIAPEKARGKSEDFRSDMYSLGATLFHALAGKPPFDGPTPTDVVVARLKAPAPDVRDFNSKVTAKTAAVLKRTMDPTPAMRYPTYDSFLADLREALNLLRAERAKASAPPPKKRSKLPMIIAGISVLVALAIILINNGKKKGDPNKPPPSTDQSLKQDYWQTWQRGDQTPFSRNESRQLIAAMALMKPGSTMSPLDALVREKSKYAKGSPARAWVDTYQTVMHMANGEADPAKELLKGLLTPNAVVFESPTPPPENPVNLCEFIANRLDEPELRRRSRSAQDWYKQLVDVFVAFKNTIRGNVDKTPSLLNAYNRTEHDFQWSYALQPFTRKMAEDAEKFNKINANTGLNAGQKLLQLNEFANGNYAYWKTAVRNSAPEVGGIETLDQMIKSTKPLLYWRLNDTQAGRVAPEVDSANQNSATIVLNCFGQTKDALAIGRDNTYFSFKERSAHDFISNLVKDGQLSGNAGAVTFWFRTDTAENNEMFYAKLGNDALRVRMLGSGVCEASLTGPGGFNLKSDSATRYNNGTWTQMVFSWNGPGNNVTLAVRPLEGEGQLLTGNFAGRNETFSSVRFGRDEYNNAVLYKGDLDELAVWNRALTQAEISLLSGLAK